MVTLSVVIPHWSDGLMQDAMLVRLLASMPTGREYEYIVVDNEGIGFPRALNLGAMSASGDFVAFVNNDMLLLSGDPMSCCTRGQVVSPVVMAHGSHQRGNLGGLHGSFFVMERGLFYQLGGMDERFDIGCFSDVDLFHRIEDEAIPIMIEHGVVVEHLTEQTIMPRIGGKGYEFRRLQKVYEEKWGTIWDEFGVRENRRTS